MIPITPDDGVVDATGSSKMGTSTAKRRGNHHTANIRLSIPPLASRCYLTHPTVRERRSGERANWRPDDLAVSHFGDWFTLG